MHSKISLFLLPRSGTGINSRLRPCLQHWLPTNFLFMYPLSLPNIVINWYYINFYLYLFALALRWRPSACWTPMTSACSTLPPFPTCTGPSSGTTALFTRHSKKLVGMDSAPQVWVRIWILKFINAKIQPKRFRCRSFVIRKCGRQILWFFPFNFSLWGNTIFFFFTLSFNFKMRSRYNF